jgi:hypothetical protein
MLNMCLNAPSLDNALRKYQTVCWRLEIVKTQVQVLRATFPVALAAPKGEKRVLGASACQVSEADFSIW